MPSASQEPAAASVGAGDLLTFAQPVSTAVSPTGYFTRRGTVAQTGQSINGWANPVWFGADPTGVTPCDAAVTAALAFSNHLRFPPGKFLFNSKIAISLADYQSVAIEGSGPEITTLFFPTGGGGTPASGGIGIAMATMNCSVQLRGFTLLCAMADAGTAIAISNLQTGIMNPAASATSTIENIVTRGTYYEWIHWWTTAVACVGVSNINVYNVSDYGSNVKGGSGTGFYFKGTGACSCVFNMYMCQANQRHVGLWIDTLIQGVYVDTFQVVAGTFGVYNPPGGTELDEFTMIQSQFNIQSTTANVGDGAWGVKLMSNWPDVTIGDCVFIAVDDYTGAIEFTGGIARGAIYNNSFIGMGHSQTGLAFTSATDQFAVYGNDWIGDWPVGVYINPLVGRLQFFHNDFTKIVTGQEFVGVTNTLPGSQVTIKDNLGYNPQGVLAPVAVGPGSPFQVNCGPSPETHYINQSATSTATIVKGGVTLLTLKDPSTRYPLHCEPNDIYFVNWGTTAPTIIRDIH